jgi:biotin synthase
MTIQKVRELYQLQLNQLVETAHAMHRENFPLGEIQASALLSIKTGGCPENCSYCPQSAHYETGVGKTKLMEREQVVAAALRAKDQGATRFCMGAAWRQVKDGPEFDQVCELVSAVREVGLEVCCTLGMLNPIQAQRLKEAGLYAYNHNIDSSREFYSKIIQTRTYDDRLNTIKNVRSAGMTVCTGGILGMGETEEDRIAFIHQLASFDPQPESVTVNTLIPIEGTPLAKQNPVAALDVVRVVATLRLTNPKSMIRLSAGRLSMTDEAQFLCFYAGANSIFFGDVLLTSANPSIHQDQKLMERCGFRLKETDAEAHTN